MEMLNSRIKDLVWELMKILRRVKILIWYLVKQNSVIGIVYKNKDNKIKEIGVLCKVIGIIKELFAFNNQNFSSLNYIKLEAICRIKILDYKKINEKYENSDLAYSPIEILEDEISNL